MPSTKSSVMLSKTQLVIDGFQVMQSWEINYMKMLADIVTQNGGRILEIGFGMGISAGFIQKSGRTNNHIIIEPNTIVLQHAKAKFKKKLESRKISLLEGCWQDIAPKLQSNSFDGILFDSFSSSKSPKKEELLFIKEAFRLLKSNGVLTYYENKKNGLSNVKELKKIGFRKINYKVCKVKPASYCNYYKNTTITAPILIK